jgi:RimJ/RimL family protein N-acetyltransferase
VDDTKRLVAVWVRKKLHLSWALEIGGQAEGEIEIIKDLPEKGFMLGYILSEECWGQGYMSEALQAVLKHMFANGYEYAMAETDTENLLSSKLLIHNGFQVVLKEENRYIAKKKTYVDVFQFRLTKAAYEKALK